MLFGLVCEVMADHNSNGCALCIKCTSTYTKAALDCELGDADSYANCIASAAAARDKCILDHSQE